MITLWILKLIASRGNSCWGNVDTIDIGITSGIFRSFFFWGHLSYVLSVGGISVLCCRDSGSTYLVIELSFRCLCHDVRLGFGEACFSSWTPGHYAGMYGCCPSLCSTERAVWPSNWRVSAYTGLLLYLHNLSWCF